MTAREIIDALKAASPDEREELERAIFGDCEPLKMARDRPQPVSHPKDMIPGVRYQMGAGGQLHPMPDDMSVTYTSTSLIDIHPSQR